MRALELALRQQAFIRRRRRPGPRPRVPLARFPRAAQLQYQRDIGAVLDIVETFVRRDVIPLLPGLLGPPRSDGAVEREDMTGSLTAEALERVKRAVETVLPDRRIGLLAESNALRVSEHGRGELQRQVQSVLKIDLFVPDAGLAQHIETFVADNVRLIKSLSFTQLDDIKGIVLRGARQGLRVEEVQKQIQARFGVAKDKAALIARDQIGKLNGEIAELRQTQLGLRRYTWSTSHDERVRPMHRALEGTVHKWSKPPIVDKKGTRAHPGQDIQCRCQPVPILDDVLEDAGLLEPTPATAAPPAPAPVNKPRAPRAPASPAPKWMTGSLEVTHREFAGVGMNAAEFLDLRAPDGKTHRVVWKTIDAEHPGLRDGIDAGSYHAREAAMFALDHELGGEGVVPPTVSRMLEGMRGSMQAFVPNAVSTRKALSELERVGVARLAQDPRQRRMFLLDVIAANDDRHAGNVMWQLGERGRVPAAVAIDNGLTFPKGGPSRFIFAIPDEDFARAMLALDDKSIRELRALKLPRVAAALRRQKGGITREQIRETLARIKDLQNDPEQLAIMPTGYRYPDDWLVRWMRRKPEERQAISAAELAEIDVLAGGPK